MLKINTIEHIFMYLVVEGISIPILMLCLSSLWQFHTGDLWYLALIWFVCVQLYLLFHVILSLNISVFINWAWYINIVTVNERIYIKVAMYHLSFFDLRIAITLWYISPVTYVWSSYLVNNKYGVPYFLHSDK
jgi:hypothetical protein